MEKELQVVGFRIGNETYGVRIASVREIVRVPEITTVPSAPDLIEGVINPRGKIIPVMDLRKRFGQTEVKLVATMLLQRLRFDALPGRTMTVRQMPTLSPKGGLRMRVLPRA